MSDLEFLPDSIPASQKGKKKRELKSPAARVGTTRDQANLAAGGRARTQGRKKQLNTRVPEDMFQSIMDGIQHHAGELGVTQDSIQLWCLLYGLDALEKGVTPELSQAKTRNEIIF